MRVLAQRAVFSARFKILFLSLAIAGCAAQPEPAPRPVMVKIPVATPIYCDVPALQRPPLAIAMLTPDSAPADTIRSYAATVDVLKSAVEERDAILKGCGAPTDDTAASASQASLRGPSTPQTPLGMTQGKSPEISDARAASAPTFAGALVGKLRGMIPW